MERRRPLLPLLFTLLVLLSAAAAPASADWWDDFVDSVHTKLVDGASFIKEKAGPSIREKFDSAKAKLQDPQTHEDAQQWVKEKAVPVIEDNWNKLKVFINEEVAPQAYKVYQAAVEAHERQKQHHPKDVGRVTLAADSHERGN